MKTAVTAMVGLIAGFLTGILLSAIIGIVGFLIFGRAVGIKYLPIYLAAVFAIVAPAVRVRIRRRSK